MVGLPLDIMGNGIRLAIGITICLNSGGIEMTDRAHQEEAHRMGAKVWRQETDP